jgi:hypothetical protein
MINELEKKTLLVILEEMSEVQHIICKIYNYGWENWHPADVERTSNISLLEKELGHLLHAIDLLVKNSKIDSMKIDFHKEIKSRDFFKWRKDYEV